MESFPLLSAFTSLAGTALQVMNAFHRTSVTNVIGTGGGRGFWNFYSHSRFKEIPCPMTMVPQYINSLAQMVCNQNPGIAFLRNNLVNDMNEILNLGSYESGQVATATDNVVTYDKPKGLVHFYIFSCSPAYQSSYNGKWFTSITTFYLSINLVCSQPWMITHQIKSSLMKTTGKVGIQYLPDPGWDARKQFEALQIALAPMVLGLVPVPATILEVFANLISNGVDGKTGAPMIDFPTQQASINQMTKTRELQAAGVDNAYKALQDFAGILNPKQKGPEKPAPQP